MARPFNPDLTKYWKVCLPAPLAGTVELYLFDRIHGKPQYGARAKLITDLLDAWVADQKLLAEGKDPITENARVITNEVMNALSDTTPNPAAVMAAVQKSLENLRARN